MNTSNDGYAVRTSEDTVRIERTLPGPIDRVWAYLTESDKRRQWLASGDMALHVGGPVELVFRHAELSDVPGETPARYADVASGHVNAGHITACDPPHLLAYTWGENHDDPSEVRFELSEHGPDVRLVVVHSRLASRKAMRGYAGGWHTHLDVLAERLAGHAPGNFWVAHARMEAEYATRMSDV